MYIKRVLPKKFYAIVDRNVITNPDLSDGAKLLYAFLVGIPPGGNYTDAYLMKALGLSKRAIINRKNELRKADLLYIERLSSRVFQAYIGNSNISGMQVAAEIKATDCILEEEK